MRLQELPGQLLLAGGDVTTAPGPQLAQRAVDTLDLPDRRGDFGSGVVDLLGSEDVFVSLIEYGSEVADQGLFANQGVPRLAPSQFGPNRLQRPLPGRSASQHFFSVGGRAFCLFTVIGSHSRRMATVPRAAEVVRSFRVTDRATMVRRGEMS